MKTEIAEKYGNRVRMRVCGICWKEDRILLINHRHLTQGNFWAPPGGGIEFGELIKPALKREFLEEAGVQVNVGRFMFGCEFIQKPLHAIELFFEVVILQGTPQPGFDPESQGTDQLITAIQYFSFNELMAVNQDERHAIFRIARTADELKKLTGFYTI